MKMKTEVIFFTTFAKYILGTDVIIKTEDSGHKTSDNVPNVVEYYTALSTYGIFPTEERFLTFQIKACAHAYVLFSESYNISNAKQFYEIVIGGHGNTRDIIRRRYKNGRDTQLIMKFVKSLRCHQYSNFSIGWSLYGNVQLKKDADLILNLKDDDPILVNAFGIRTGFGNAGRWIFNVKVDKPMCRCSCEYKSKLDFWSKQNLTGYTREELMEMLYPKLEAIRKKLKVNKYNLSTNRRKRTSAQDSRKSASQIGIVGIIFLCIVVGLIIMIDITTVQKDKKKFRSPSKIIPMN